MALTIEKLRQAKAMMDTLPNPDHIVFAYFGCGLPDEEQTISDWWNIICLNDIITGAYQGLSWDELPSHAQDAARKLYESCQH